MSAERFDLLARLERERVVAVLRRVPDVDRVVEVLDGNGIRIVEITLDSDAALETIQRLRTRRGLAVLAGTVRTAADVDAAVEAGASACVFPGTFPEALTRCLKLGVQAVPGALTPSEVEHAWRSGATVVKLFPASLGGPRYVRELLAPLHDIPLMVSGGVSTGNAAEFLRAGATAVGVGSCLSNADDLALETRRLVEATQRVE